jgi:hypothetical protein
VQDFLNPAFGAAFSKAAFGAAFSKAAAAWIYIK